MTPKIKLSILILILIVSISCVIVLDLPLFWGLLLTCLMGFFLIKYKRHLSKLIYHNTKSVYKTMLLMFMISITLPVLMSSGTLPTLIFYVSDWMVGHNLLLSAFWVSLMLSMVLGSAIGTLTILLPLFSSIALQSGMNYPLLLGALISGIYIGDRCSPISSALHLLSQLTETDYRKNLKTLLISAAIPFMLTSILFLFIGKESVITTQMVSEIIKLNEQFDLALWRLLPLCLMLILIVIRQPIARVLGMVFLLCSAMTLFHGTELSVFFDTLIHGYENIDYAYIRTSGFKQMINVILVILLSGVLNSYLEADGLIQPMIDPFTTRLRSKRQLIVNTGLLSILLCMITCSQAMTSIITGKYLSPYFEKHHIPKEYLVMACSNTGLSIVAMIPWNVNGIMISELSGIKTLDYLGHSYFILILLFLTLFVYPLFVDYRTNR